MIQYSKIKNYGAFVIASELIAFITWFCCFLVLINFANSLASSVIATSLAILYFYQKVSCLNYSNEKVAWYFNKHSLIHQTENTKRSKRMFYVNEKI